MAFPSKDESRILFTEIQGHGPLKDLGLACLTSFQGGILIQGDYMSFMVKLVSNWKLTNDGWEAENRGHELVTWIAGS